MTRVSSDPGSGRPAGDQPTGAAADPIRVMLADDNPEVRSMLARVIELDAGCVLVAQAGDAQQAIQEAERARPDVVLVDVNMPGGGGPVAARGIRSASPMTKVVVLSAHDDEASIRRMFGEGIHGYLAKGESMDEILAAVRRAMAGDNPLSPGVARKVIEELSGRLRHEHAEASELEEARRRIQAAVQGEGLMMVFQPIVDLTTRKPIGVEALARFSQPGWSPSMWFTRAHEVGMGVDLEVAAIRAAMRSADLIPSNLYLSVNASPETILSGRLFPLIEDAARNHRLLFEVTEEAAVTDYEALSGAVEEMRRQDVGLAVDDAGAGYASFRHILELSPDVIKLDMTLVRHIDRASPRKTLAVAIAGFAAENGASIVAEGIETEGEAETLVEIGVTVGQGYLLGRPAPAEALAEGRVVVGPDEAPVARKIGNGPRAGSGDGWALRY